MIVNKQRPVNLDLRTIRMPITAIVSILHRMTGVLLFILIPFILWVLSFSLRSADNLAQLQSWMGNFWLRFFLWVFFAGMFYHIVAGIRHLLLDIHIGETLMGGRIGAWIVFFLSFIVIVLTGIYFIFNINLAIW